MVNYLVENGVHTSTERVLHSPTFSFWYDMYEYYLYYPFRFLYSMCQKQFYRLTPKFFSQNLLTDYIKHCM